MRKLLFAIAIISCSIFGFPGCSKSGGQCEEPYFITASSIQVIFKDKNSGKYLYEEVAPIYDINDIRIFNQDRQSLLLLKSLNNIPNTPQRYWEVNFGPLFNPQTDQSSFQTELCKEFYIRYTEVEPMDTVMVCYTSKELKCGSVFPSLKIYYKEELISSKANDTGAVVTINKE